MHTASCCHTLIHAHIVNKLTEMANFSAMNLTGLRKRLKDKGITTGRTRKRDLINLLEKVDCMYDDLEPCDQHDSQRKRRVVETASGTKIDLNDLKVSWTKSLRNIPDITDLDIYSYLLSHCCWTQTKLKSYREQDGYKMFLDRHVESLDVGTIAGGSSDFVYIKGKVKPEQRQSADRYDTWILVSKACEIQSAGCQCVAADDGSCKHVVCLLFAVADYNKTRNDRSAEVGTDKLCVWTVPRQQSQPMRVEELDFRHNKALPTKPVPTPQYFQPIHDLQPSRVEFLQNGLQELCNKVKPGALFLTLTDRPKSVSTNIPPTIYDLVKQHKDEASEMILTRYISERISSDDIYFLSNLSQADPRWLESRKGRLTASHASSILACKFRSQNKSLVSQVVHQEFKDNKNFQHGHKYEPVARQRYLDEEGPKHKSFCVTETGLHIDDELPYIGASPDGIVSCKCHGKKVLEIKCTVKHYTQHVGNIPNVDKSYHLEIRNNELTLKESSPWYQQMQFQMGVLRIHAADLVVYTKHGIAVIPVPWDPQIWQRLVDKAILVFQRVIVPSITTP